MKLLTTVFCLLITSTAALPLFAQGIAEPQKAVKITLHTMAAPRPVLKYQLLPPFLDRKPGNAAVLWNRIPAERTHFFNDFYKEGGDWDKIDAWVQIPLSDPREKQILAKEPVIRQTLTESALFRDMYRAARFDACDWQFPLREGNPIAMLIPEVQQTRTFSRLLVAKAHLEIAEGDYGKAVETMQTCFALSRHVARGETLVNGLVGIAIAGNAANQIEQMIQQPDAPNLYWALTTLPRPLIDLGPAFEAESSFFDLQFPGLRDLETKDADAEQWRALLEKTVVGWMQIEPMTGGGPSFPAHRAAITAFAVQGYPVARQYLIDHGRSEAEVDKMPVAKAILLCAVETFHELGDEEYKLMLLPYAEAVPFFDRVERQLKETKGAVREVIPFATLLLPALKAAKSAEARMAWILARLRIFEALRIYAAGHDGKLPDRLEDITEVPIPRNPFDDKQFEYHRDGNQAVLDCQHGPPGLPWRYEITMQGKGE
jgi:hypothetical protein